MTVRAAKRHALAAVVAGLLGLSGPGGAHAIEVTIIEPEVPLTVEGTNVKWTCHVEYVGDQGLNVKWTWNDGPGEVQEGFELTEVWHTCATRGEWTVTCEATDLATQETDSDELTFRVLWVIYCLSKRGGAVDLDNNAAEDFHYAWTRPHTIDLGLQTGLSGLRYCVEFYGSTYPVDWGDVAPGYENPVELHRRFGPLGGRLWNGAEGDQLHLSVPPDEDDTSDPSARDDEPQSIATWDMESPYKGTYPSVGCVYDIDRPGYSDKNAGICRIRVNFVEWAEWGYTGQVCSDELPLYVAFSCRWNPATEEWDLVDDVGGLDNSSEELHLSSLDWDLEG